MNQIVKIDESMYEEIIELFHKSFGTVVNDFGITKENSKHNAAFIELDEFINDINNGLELYILKEQNSAIGSIGIIRNDNELFYIKRLCVDPKHRHKKYGQQLLEYAISEIRRRDGKRITIGIINENDVLKKWYLKHGFNSYDIKKIENLPFTVCLMELML